MPYYANVHFLDDPVDEWRLPPGCRHITEAEAMDILAHEPVVPPVFLKTEPPESA